MNIFEGPLPAYPASLITLVVKNLSGNAGDIRDKGSIPGLGRSPGRGHGNPLQLLFPGVSHEQRSLTGHCPWDCKGSDMTKVT